MIRFAIFVCLLVLGYVLAPLAVELVRCYHTTDPQAKCMCRLTDDPSDPCFGVAVPE